MTISIQSSSTVLPLTNIKTIILAPPTAISKEGAGMMCKIESVTDMSDRGSVRRTKADAFLGVAVIQSNNSIITEILSGLGGNILRYIGPTNNWKGTDKFDSLVRDYLTDRGIRDTVADFKSKNMIVKTAKLYSDGKGPTLEKMGNDGQKMITIPHEFDFAVSSRTPSYLALRGFKHTSKE